MFAALAYAIAVFHGFFILFILTGGFAALIWPAIAWAHGPIAVWGILISIFDRTCPLTPLENWLRAKGNRSTYEEGYIDHYIVPVVYPPGFTPTMKVGIILFLIVSNATTYTLFFIRYW